MLSLSVWFALHTVFAQVDSRTYGWLHVDVPNLATLEPGALLLSAAALIAMLRFRLAMGWTLMFSAALGAIYWWTRYGAA